MKKKKFDHWDICMYLHAMSDMGCDMIATQKTGQRVYSRSHTYNAECYIMSSKMVDCPRNGKCLIAEFHE